MWFFARPDPFNSSAFCLYYKVSTGAHQLASGPYSGCPCPYKLPAAVVGFCANALEAQPDSIESAWVALQDTLWAPYGSELPDETRLIRDAHMLDTFLTHGMKHWLGLHTILPPICTCLDIHCQKVTADGTAIPQSLSKLEKYEATLFT